MGKRLLFEDLNNSDRIIEIVNHRFLGYGRHAKIPYNGGQVPVGYKMKHRGKLVPSKKGVKRSIHRGYAPLGEGAPLTSYFGWGSPYRHSAYAYRGYGGPAYSAGWFSRLFSFGGTGGYGSGIFRYF